MDTLDYQAMRPHVRSGDLIAFEGKTFTSRLIRSWTGSRYAHVGVAMWLAAGGASPRLFLLESRRKQGVTMRLLSSAGSCWFIPTHINWTPEINRFVWPRLGNSTYDWLSITRLIAFRSPKRDASYYCSEFASEVLLRGGFPLSVDDFVDPGSLVTAVLRSGPGQIYWFSPSTDHNDALSDTDNQQPVQAQTQLPQNMRR